MANFLVTGGGGFIGSHIVEHLVRAGHAVRVLDNFSTGFRTNLASVLDQVDLIEGDVRAPADCARAVRDIEYVLHHGALSSVPRSLIDPVLCHEVNVTGTLNLLAAARDAKIRRFVLASSSSVYGNPPANFNPEGLRLQPLSPYAASKAAGEQYLTAFSNSFGLESVALRYFNVFGPRQDPHSAYSSVVPLFVQAIVEGRRPIIHGDGLQVRDFTYIDNVARANVLATTCELKDSSRVFNIAGGEPCTILDLLGTVCEILGVKVQPVFAEARNGDVRSSKADISRAREELGYQAAVSRIEGLRRTIRWFESAHSAPNAALQSTELIALSD